MNADRSLCCHLPNLCIVHTFNLFIKYRHLLMNKDIRKLYQLLDEIGQGGLPFVKVYKAIKVDTGDIFAIKQTVLSDDIGSGFIQEAEKEVSLLASVNHPCIVTYYGHGLHKTTDGKTVFWVVMQVRRSLIL